LVVAGGRATATCQDSGFGGGEGSWLLMLLFGAGRDLRFGLVGGG
jgi:hypothetical protein